MKMRLVKIVYGKKKISLFETERAGQKFVGTIRECLLIGMGYGTDQGAELRYEMARLNRLKNKSE